MLLASWIDLEPVLWSLLLETDGSMSSYIRMLSAMVINTTTHSLTVNHFDFTLSIRESHVKGFLVG